MKGSKVAMLGWAFIQGLGRCQEHAFGTLPGPLPESRCDVTVHDPMF